MLQAVLVLAIFTFTPRITFPVVLFIIYLHHGGFSFLLTSCKGTISVSGGNHFLYSHFLACWYMLPHLTAPPPTPSVIKEL